MHANLLAGNYIGVKCYTAREMQNGKCFSMKAISQSESDRKIGIEGRKRSALGRFGNFTNQTTLQKPIRGWLPMPQQLAKNNEKDKDVDDDDESGSKSTSKVIELDKDRVQTKKIFAGLGATRGRHLHLELVGGKSPFAVDGKAFHPLATTSNSGVSVYLNIDAKVISDWVTNDNNFNFTFKLKLNENENVKGDVEHVERSIKLPFSELFEIEAPF